MENNTQKTEQENRAEHKKWCRKMRKAIAAAEFIEAVLKEEMPDATVEMEEMLTIRYQLTEVYQEGK
jgi:hypothetical protein